MSFLEPTAFFLAALLPVIVIMYLLKLRRTEQVVSSVYLWRRMVRDVEANAPWQRLRRNWLLILQLLFLSLLILALARPFTWAPGVTGQAAILILDTSASMAASDVAPNRLEAAKSQAHRLVNDMPAEARITVIAAGAKAQVMIASSLDRRQVNQAISNITVQTGGSDLAVALQLASAIAARQPDTQIVILSDGGATLPERLTVKGAVRFLPIGIRNENQAINLLNVTLSPGGQSASAFAQVVNYSDHEVSRRLGIYADGQLIQAYDLVIPSGKSQPVLTEGLSPQNHLVEARLLPTENGSGDDLILDDRALAVLRQAQPVKVNLVSQGNRFLETALSLLPGLQVTRYNLSDDVQLPDADLTILDSFIPLTTTLPTSNLFFIAPPRSTQFFTITGILQQPTPQAPDPSHPLLSHVVVNAINILDADQIALPYWAHPLITTDLTADEQAAPLLFTGEPDGRRVAVLAFDIRRSDLPLQIAFPILLSNLIGWLAPGSSGDIPAQVTPGAAITIQAPTIGENGEEIAAVIVTRPDSSQVHLNMENLQTTFADTMQLGLYTIQWDQQPNTSRIEFTVNLFSPQESTLSPAASLPIEGILTDSQINQEQHARRDWWRQAAVLALVLLTIEWMVYQRSALAFLRDRLPVFK